MLIISLCNNNACENILFNFMFDIAFTTNYQLLSESLTYLHCIYLISGRLDLKQKTFGSNCIKMCWKKVV